MDRSVEMVVALLAVLKSGAAYVPLDPFSPAARNSQILTETRVAVLFTLEHQRHTVPTCGGEVWCVDSLEPLLDTNSVVSLPAVSSEALAYVIFTSGSTGNPKGVEIPHYSVVNLLNDMQHRLEMNDSDRLLAVTTLSFDIAVLELLLPLVSGGTVLLATRKDALDGARLKTKLEEYRATAIQATPYTFRQLLTAGFQPPANFKMFCGGESWPSAMAAQLLTGNGRLWNMYGPTETTVWSAATEVQKDATNIYIGPPISNTRFYVLDDHQSPVAPGETGELWIGGIGVARGYWQQPRLTAERFVADREVRGERMYRTGDRVLLLADGCLAFVGRVDHQVKYRGFRIELGEVESAILKIPGVKQAAVVLRKEDGDNDALLAGFYETDAPLTPEQIRYQLQQLLPNYMVPQVLRHLIQMPATPNGKLDRGALLQIDFLAPAQLDSNVVNPTPPTQTVAETMTAIWQVLFPDEEIKPETDFFDLGGDSLLVLQLQAMVERQLHVSLTLADVYRASSITALIAHVEEAQRPALPYDAAAAALNSRLMPLRTGGSGHPVFLMPQNLLLEKLANELGDVQPVYAMELLEEDITTELATANFERLVSRYCEIIREVQPRGPYYLGGWCMWGLVAYEAARQMEKDGDQIAYVLVMDAISPGYWNRHTFLRKLSIYLVHRVYRTLWLTNRLWHSDSQRRRADISRRLGNAWISFKETLEGRKGPKSRVQKTLSRAALSYAGGPLAGPVLLIKGDHRPVGPFINDDLGWSEVVGHPVDVAVVEGNHSEIFDAEGVRIITRQVRALTNPEAAHDMYFGSGAPGQM